MEKHELMTGERVQTEPVPDDLQDTHPLGTCLRFANGESCVGCGDSENGIPLEFYERISRLEQENRQLREQRDADRRFWLDEAARIAESYIASGMVKDIPHAIRSLAPPEQPGSGEKETKE